MVDSDEGSREPRERPRRSALAQLFPTPTLAVVVLLICFVVPGVLIARWVQLNPKLSPIDEAAHLDYVIRASHGEIPRTGEPMTPQAARIISCTGVALDGLVLPPCETRKLDVRDFPAGGSQYEAQQPPLYYATTAVLRVPVAKLLGIDSYVTSTRVTGYLWAALGLFCLWIVTRVLRIDPWISAAVLLLLACTPDVIVYTSIVSNDAPSLLFGSLALLCMVLALRNPSVRSTIALVAVGVAAGLTKFSDVFPIAALALYALWTLYRQHGTVRATAGPWMRTGGALLGGALVATLAWLAVRSGIALVDPRTLPVSIDNPLRGGTRLGPFLEELVSLFGPATDSVSSRWVADSLSTSFIEITRTLLLVAAFLGLFVRPRLWFHRLGLSTLVAMVVCGTLLAYAFWVTLNQDPTTQSRYGLALVPLLGVTLAAAGGAVHDRRVTVAFCAISMTAFAATLSVLV